MSEFARLLGVVWFVVVPFASLAAGAVAFRRVRIARRRDLLGPVAYRWLAATHVASQTFVWAMVVAAVVETAIWPPLLAIVAVLVMAVGAYQSARSLHPGLHGFTRPLPRDGIELLGWESRAERWRRRAGWLAASVGPFVPALVICVYALALMDGRWIGRWVAAAAVASPLLLIPHRRLIAPLLLLPLVLVQGLQAIRVRDMLPAGRWTTPISAANCSSHVRFTIDRSRAWCVDGTRDTVYQFSPASGLIRSTAAVPWASDVIGGGNDIAWIIQDPIQSLVRVQGDGLERDRLVFPRRGSVDAAGRLWVIDTGLALSVIEPGQPLRSLDSRDGLLGNTANVVRVAPDGSIWVGSVGGLSHRADETVPWELISRGDGVPGPVHDIAFAVDGSTWILWKDFATSRAQVWGVSQLRGADWQHFLLGDATGLDPPATSDSLAIDGLGRVWFTAVSYAERSNYLGVFSPQTQTADLHRLGPFVPTTTVLVTTPSRHGVVSDGEGGIYLYNPSRDPLRHWRPG